MAKKDKKDKQNPLDSLPLSPNIKSSDVAVRFIAVGIGVFLVLLYLTVAVGLYPIVDSRLGGWFTAVCWLVVMALVTNLFVPGWSFVGKMWMASSPRRRWEEQQKQKQQRDRYELMSARGRQRYGAEGPPESRNGDVSPDRYKGRDAGAR